MVTVFEGPRQCGKTSHLALCVADRVRKGNSCFVYALTQANLDVLRFRFEKNLGDGDKSKARFYMLSKKAIEDLRSWKTRDICLFIDEGEYNRDNLDSLMGHKPGWKEVFLTRTTGPDAPPQRTLH